MNGASQTALPAASATPEQITATAALEQTAAPGDTPAPEAGSQTMPEGVVNLMVLGSDWREESGHRTDVIMLVSVNTVKQTVSVISFPRDLYVPIPGWTTGRINTAEPHGGFAMLADTMESNFGVRPSYYMMTDFQGFRSIVDGLGGVDIYAGSQLEDRCDLPMAADGFCTVTPGRNSMDGATALWYIRSRHNSTDLDRLRRAQEVLMGIFVKLMTGGAASDLPGTYARFQGAVKTDLGVDALIPLLPTALNVFANQDAIHRYALTVKEAKPYKTESGAQVLLPDYPAIQKILDEAIFTP